ncbi:MAG: type II secretion system F family protein [Candidatus Harrisonbacteria bacterium]|nr:type II secretion system F family protein [Candidatus Harrisonbacteria bacterium]
MSVRLKSSEKLEIISNLGAMLTSGIPLLESVEALLDGARKRSKIILENLKKDLEAGKTIADSFARFPDSFDPVAINLIRGGEEAGNLEDILKDLSETIRKDIEFDRKVKGALAYPIFVIIVFIGIMIVILSFVIPRIAQVFTKLRVNIPLPTRILIWMSGILLNYWPWIIVFAILSAAGFFFLYRTRRRQLFAILSSLPLISGLAREIDLVRFTRSMALLLSSGIPIAKSLDLSRNVLVRPELIRLIEFTREEVVRGKRLTDSLKTGKDLTPQLLTRVIDAGERSGKLDQSFQRASEYFDNRVSDTIKTLTTLLEPILLVGVGLAVGAIMVSIIAPIYQLIGSIRIR